MAHRLVLISISLAVSQTPAYTVRPWIQGCCITWCVCLHPAFAGTPHCSYPWWDGQAELTWVLVYIPSQFTRPQIVTHPSTHQAQQRVTSLIKINMSPLSQTAILSYGECQRLSFMGSEGVMAPIKSTGSRVSFCPQNDTKCALYIFACTISKMLRA